MDYIYILLIMMTFLVSLPICRTSFRKGLFSFPHLINTHYFLDFTQALLCQAKSSFWTTRVLKDEPP